MTASAAGTSPLWTWDALVAASGGVADGTPTAAITGFSLDSRGIAEGEVFVALKDQRDGHEFVTVAFETGAAAALVATGYQRKPGDGALLRVDEPLRGLERIGAAARARLAPEARVIAVTGSAGKTGTKEMLRACLAPLGPTHAPEKSFNNHWGVPLTLARMPASTKYGVFEIGMNHAGEITPLTKLVRPHVAIITNVLPVHLGHFANEEAIADAKAEIFNGFDARPGNVIEAGTDRAAASFAAPTAVLNADSPHVERLAKAASLRGWNIVAFGRDQDADIVLESCELGVDGSHAVISISHDTGSKIGGKSVVFATNYAYSLGAPGEHYLMNSLAVAGALDAVGADVTKGLAALADFHAPNGRGARDELTGPLGKVLLVDEAYNANPASMRAAFATLALVPRSTYRRRIVVLGDMLELGERSVALHAGLKEAIDAAGIDLVFACGEHMRALFDRIDTTKRGAWARTAEQLRTALLAGMRDGDAVMIKGSFGSKMGPLVAALRQHVQGT